MRGNFRISISPVKMSDNFVPRDQVVNDLTLRFVSQFLRTKNKDYT